MRKRVLFLSVLILAVVSAGVFVPLILKQLEVLQRPQMKRFSSYEELKSFIEASTGIGSWSYVLAESAKGFAAPAPEPPEYSTTNIQVQGVDEADIVKTDGAYIYVVSDKSIIIVKAYPPEEAGVLSRIELNGTALGAFINQDRLAVFEGFEGFEVFEGVKEPSGMPAISIKVYDVSDRASPILKRDFALDGWYFNSRMIGDYVYAVINSPAIRYSEEGVEVTLPRIYSGGRVKEVDATEIYYANVSDVSYVFTTIVAVNVQNDMEEPAHETILMGASSNMYVSLNNIYITIPRWTVPEVQLMPSQGTVVRMIRAVAENTLIYRIHVKGREMKVEASGEVPGMVLNQFSMDEYDGYFRIATTTSHIAISMEEAASKNHIYVLDMGLNIVGKLEDLAPGERIYSARFMGERGYLVTFKKVDPLFVISLKDPANPIVLGKLKIPGYSDYLHPYDENHLIGVGKETVEAEEGNFAWYQGVKIALFDVRDLENPKELAKYEIGDRGTESPVLWDHKAFLFDRSRNLLVIPVLVAEIDEEKYPNGVPPNTYGEYVWQGAYVFHISSQDGIMLRGGITHLDDNADLKKSGYHFFSPYSVKRSLYIDNALYTISDMRIIMNSLETLAEINKVELQGETLTMQEAIEASKQSKLVQELLSSFPDAEATAHLEGDTKLVWAVGWWTKERIQSGLPYPNVLVYVDAYTGEFLWDMVGGVVVPY